MSKLENLKSYTVVEKKELPEVKGTGYILSHNKTKARVVIVENDDENKVFTIGFRTPPADDYGIPHILEHSVLCGSKNFPIKDPFVELCKGSLNTFLNAMTYADKTVYPIASMNKKDFHNLMHVYMDAVFYPDIYKHEEILQQEGWHYEIDEETDELTYNGVVFSEMLGVYSSPDQQLARIIQSELLPDTPYARESGGDPDYIAGLTREVFLDFHRTYYHPSNSYIYLYGDMNAEEELQFIDENYLKDFDYKYIESELPVVAPFDAPRYAKDYYSVSEEEELSCNTYLTYNVIVGSSLDKKLDAALSILDYALITAPGAPLKKALVDAGICKDLYSSQDDSIRQPVYSIIAKNANEVDEKKFIALIDDTLTELAQKGISKKSLEAAVNHFEFMHKEANFGRSPKGLVLGLNAFSTWLYDDESALTLFSLNEVFDMLRKEINTGYFEKLIISYIVNNSHKAYVSLVPKLGLNDKKSQETAQKLKDLKDSLSKAELDDIKATTKHLKEYQGESSTPEQLRTLPLLELEDINKNSRKLNNQIYNIEGIKVVGHNIFTNGITYLSFNYDISDITPKDYPAISLLTELFKYVDTDKYNISELADEINLHTGGIGFTANVTCKQDIDDYIVSFIVNAKMLHEKLDKCFELMSEIMFNSKITDKKRLREVVAETRSGMKDDLVSSGNSTALGRAASYISPSACANDAIDGIGYYNYIADIDDNFDERYEQVAEDLNRLICKVFRRDSLIISYTADNKPDETLAGSLKSFSKLLTDEKLSDRVLCDVEVKNEGFKASSKVQYVATAGNFRKEGLPYTAALNVLQTIFSYEYLWLNLRVKGGAYGCMCSFNSNGNGAFVSYRDPNLMETYEIYKEAADYVRGFNCDERDMTKYIIGTISRVDTPLTPSAEGLYSFGAYLMGLTDEINQKRRDEILHADVKTINSLAPYVEAVANRGVICVVGDGTKLEDNKENFKELVSIK